MPRRKKTEEENVTVNEELAAGEFIKDGDEETVDGEPKKRGRKKKTDDGHRPMGALRSIEPYRMRVRLTFIDEMLGTTPSDKEIYKTYIGSKAPDAKKLEEELETVSVEEAVENKRTVFHRDKNGNVFLYDYMIRGFFKNACKNLRDNTSSNSNGFAAYKSKIDGQVFVGPRRIKCNFPDDEVAIGICERPLRASTPQGERVALASSETVPDGTMIEFEICCLNDKIIKMIPEWLDYGIMNGLGQWHNGGKGRFVWENLDFVTGEVIEGGNKGLDALEGLNMSAWCNLTEDGLAPEEDEEEAEA